MKALEEQKLCFSKSSLSIRTIKHYILIMTIYFNQILSEVLHILSNILHIHLTNLDYFTCFLISEYETSFISFQVSYIFGMKYFIYL